MARLQILKYACNFTKCPSQPCTESNAEAILILAMVKGLVEVDIQGELLAEVEQIDTETTIAFVEIWEMNKRDTAIAGPPFHVPAANLWGQPAEFVESNSVTVMHSTGWSSSSNL